MPRQVLLDNQVFTSQVHGGISRYFAELLKNRDALGEDLELGLRLPVTLNQYLTPESGFTGRMITLPSNRQAARVILRALHELGNLPPRGLRSSALVHHTFYRPQVIQRTPGVRRVSTLHDMIPESHPEFFGAGNPHLAKKEYLEASDLIISVSRASAEEMLEHWPHLQRRVLHVVPLGVGDEFFGDGPEFTAQTPYLLHVGSRGGYKNFSVILDALAVSANDLKELHLLAVGGGAFTPEESRRIEKLGLGPRVHQRPASDAELASMYRGAAAFVFPSLHEGFGLPTLEAMACGCPTILADTPVFREVAGAAATYFDPRSAESLAEAIATLRDSTRVQQLKEAGRVRSTEFSWQAVATSTGSAYRCVL